MIYYLIEGKVDDRINKAKSEASTFYEHMLKWKYWAPKREISSNSWCNSIFRSIYQIQKIVDNKTNVVNGVNEKLKDVYDDALGIVTAKIAPDADKRFKIEHGELFEDFKTVNDILDKDRVRLWLWGCVESNSYAGGSVDHFYNLDYSKEDNDYDDLKGKIDKVKNRKKGKRFLND